EKNAVPTAYPGNLEVSECSCVSAVLNEIASGQRMNSERRARGWSVPCPNCSRLPDRDQTAHVCQLSPLSLNALPIAFTRRVHADAPILFQREIASYQLPFVLQFSGALSIIHPALIAARAVVLTIEPMQYSTSRCGFTTASCCRSADQPFGHQSAPNIAHPCATTEFTP